LFESQHGFEEQRVLLRAAPEAAREADSGIDKLFAAVPSSSPLYRAWAAPDQETVTGVLQQVVFGEGVLIENPGASAPQVTVEAESPGSAADLETRIDQPPFQRGGSLSIDPVVGAVMAMDPRALLHVQQTSVLNDQVFVVPDSEVSLRCAHADRGALDAALKQTASVVQTGSLDPLRISVAGDIVTISRLPEHSSRAAIALPQGTTYAAGYNHAAEFPRYKKLFGLVDRAAAGQEGAGAAPLFFTGNLRSLGDSLYRLSSVSIQARDAGAMVRETVRYELTAP
jgi:hypothetical protein